MHGETPFLVPVGVEKFSAEMGAAVINRKNGFSIECGVDKTNFSLDDPAEVKKT
jgi:hypothetical protein